MWIAVIQTPGAIMMFRFRPAWIAIILIYSFARWSPSAAQSTAEPIELPSPSSDAAPAQIERNAAGLPQYWIEGQDSSGQLRIFPAVLETRRYGPIEEPEHQFYALRNGQEPGYPISPPAWGWAGPGYWLLRIWRIRNSQLRIHPGRL